MQLKKLEELLKDNMSTEEIKEALGLFVGYGVGGEFTQGEYNSISQAFIEAVNYFVYLVKNK